MKRKKRILIIYNKLVGGGAERVLIDYLRHIDYDRYEVDLALVEKGGILLPQVPRQVNVIELWSKRSLHYFIAVKFSLHLHCNILFKQRLNSRRLRTDYDAEIAFLEGLPAKLLALRKSKAKKLAWIHVDLSTFHDSANFFYNSSEERRAYGKMDRLIAVSEDCRNGFAKCFPNLKNKTDVIYNPIDIQEILKKGNEPLPENLRTVASDKKTIVVVARVHHQKNPERLLQAAKIARESAEPLKFIWIGDGELFDHVDKRKKQLGLDEYVEFIGYKENPYPFIKNADILLLPSDAEGFGLVLCEAMALEVPVVSTPTAGPVEIIGDNEYGLLTGFDPASIVESIWTLTNDSRLREEIIEKGRKRVLDYSVDKAMVKFYELID